MVDYKNPECKNICIPIVLESVMNLVDNNLQICQTNEDYYCMTNHKLEPYLKLLLDCNKPCENRNYAYNGIAKDN